MALVIFEQFPNQKFKSLPLPIDPDAADFQSVLEDIILKLATTDLGGETPCAFWISINHTIQALFVIKGRIERRTYTPDEIADVQFKNSDTTSLLYIFYQYLRMFYSKSMRKAES